MAAHGKDNPGALSLAQLFSTCLRTSLGGTDSQDEVECMLLIHPGKEWDRDQRLLIAKLGIQQGRLLAWGDMLGICELGSGRDARLDEPDTRSKIEKSLQSIIDRPVHTDRATQFELYGLKPPKRFLSSSQPALDTARLEAFREKLETLQEQRWEVRRGMSITINHWTIADSEKFKTYLNLIRVQVDILIALVDIGQRVNQAMKYDIKALGWHPVFVKSRAAADMSKLRLIKDACETDYPDYAAATQGALDYLDKEWKDSYQEAMERGTYSVGSEIPGAAAYTIAQSKQLQDAYKPTKVKRPSLLNILKPKIWRRGSKDIEASQPANGGKGRSASFAAGSTPLTPPESPERSKSIAVMMTKPEIGPQAEEEMENQLTQVETATSLTGQASLMPITSMISRHDQWRTPI